MTLSPRVSLEPHDALGYTLIGVDLEPATARDALRSLELVSARLRALNDMRSVFPDVYAAVVRAVIDAVEGRRGPELRDRAWVSRLAGRFCARYLAMLSACFGGRSELAGVWAVAFDASRARGTAPAQDALLGVHAHVAFDLAPCLAEALAGADDALLESRRHDVFALGALLREALSDVVVHLTARYDCGATRSLASHPLLRQEASAAGTQLVHLWRAHVWDDAMSIRSLRGDARASFLATLDRNATRTACWMAAATRAPDPRWIIDALLGLTARLPVTGTRPLAA